MCELLGMSANVPTDICFSFTGLIRRSGETGPHKDGWGIAFYEGKGLRLFRDPTPAVNSPMAQFIKSYPIKSKAVISHIRLATHGKVALENTHPFTRELWGQQWTFAHNGKLKGIKKRKLKFYQPVGTTDSEYAFCWILDGIRRSFPAKPASTTALNHRIKVLLDDVHGLGKFNVLMSNGELLFAYCSTKLFWIVRKAPFGRATLIDVDVQVDFQKETSANDVVSVIATQPLTTNEQWQPMNKGELKVFKQGIVIYE